MTGVLRFFSIIFILLAISGCYEKNTDGPGDLVRAFGSSCVTSGNWSQQALSHSAAIETVIQNLRNSDPCKPFQASLGVIQTASTQIQALAQDQTYVNYRVAEEDVQNLSLAVMNAPTGSPLNQSLNEALNLAQVQLAHSRAENFVNESVSRRNRYVTATLQLSNLAQQMLAQSGNLTQCLAQSPGVAVQLATNLVAISGGFVSPVLGANLASIGQLMNLALEATHQSAYDSALNKIDDIQMSHALGCGLESISELYCNAGDALQLIKLQARKLSNPIVPDFWQGMDLLTKRMSVLDTWLLSVRNGVMPGDEEEANRQNKVWQKLQVLDETFRNVYALQAKNRRIYDASNGNPDNQENILVKTISGSVSALNLSPGYSSGPTLANPFLDQTSDLDLYACWFVLGPQMKPANPQTPNEPNMCPLKIENDSEDTREKYIRIHLLKYANFSGLQENWKSLVTVVRNSVNIEFEQTISANPAAILAAIKEPPMGNISAFEVLRRLQVFLQDQISNDDGLNPARSLNIQNVLAQVSKAINLVENGTNRAGVALADFFELFQLAHGTQFFYKSISDIITWDLNRRVLNHEFPTDVNEILQISGSEIMTRLSAAGVRDLDAVQIDLNKARSITIGNLAVFREYFQKAFGDSIEHLYQQSKSNGEDKDGIDRPFGQTLGHLCLLVLTTGMEWPKDLPWEKCSGSVLNSIFKDSSGKMSLQIGELAEKLKGLSLNVRACTFHRFLQMSRYSELYGREQSKPINSSFKLREVETPEVLKFVSGYQ